VARVEDPGYFSFHVKQVMAVARHVGLELQESQIDQMRAYRDWLAAEATKAGGIGPGEVDRLESRHLADSLLFASQFQTPEEVWDLGSGVGLPGIPLAIAFPATRFRLIDRAGRRVDLARRAIRVLELENCLAEQREIEDLDGQVGVIVSRAALPPHRMAEVADRLLKPGGTAVVAGSWRERPEQPGWTTVEIPPDWLDRAIWLLIMRRA
jgi:16S rRNA (guanine527-N7)-methyltransferase